MKIQAWMTSLLFALILLGLSVCFFLLPDKAFSTQENRPLQGLPRLTLQKLLSGSYAREINAYFADQFPLRDAWVGGKGALEIALGRQENDGILLGKGGYLARRKFDVRLADGSRLSATDAIDRAAAEAACAGIARAVRATHCQTAILLTGRSLDVVGAQFDYPTAACNRLPDAVREGLDADICSIDAITPLRAAFAQGESVYFRTDHHWTAAGAYLAYVEVMRAFGMEQQILPPDRFVRHTVSRSFYGSLWSAGGMKWVKPDEVELWLAGNEDDFSVIADGRELPGLYCEEWLTKKDHYSVFLDGVHDVVTVCRKDGAPRPRLLLVKDSFANSLAPFLAQHFDLVLLNLSSTRRDMTDLSGAARQYEADRVLLVYTLENLLTADRLARLH